MGQKVGPDGNQTKHVISREGKRIRHVETNIKPYEDLCQGEKRKTTSQNRVVARGGGINLRNQKADGSNNRQTASREKRPHKKMKSQTIEPSSSTNGGLGVAVSKL